MTALLVVVGALVGAPLRYVVELVVRWWLRAGDDTVPWGTAAVNLVGSAVIGVVAGATTGRADAGTVTALVGTGFCGALTTYSAFSYETVRLVQVGRAPAALAYAVGSLVAGVALCWAGYGVVVALS